MKSMKDEYVVVTSPDQKICVAFHVELAQTDEEKERGLAFRLHINHGMLFEMTDEDKDGAFWMKDTAEPLDMLFADKNGIIHTIVKNAEPMSEDYIFYENAAAILELPAGKVDKNGIKEGFILHCDHLGNV